jgi:hypothetical protein
MKEAPVLSRRGFDFCAPWYTRQANPSAIKAATGITANSVILGSIVTEQQASSKHPYRASLHSTLGACFR